MHWNNEIEMESTEHILHAPLIGRAVNLGIHRRLSAGA
jgi:hypothetical protein